MTGRFPMPIRREGAVRQLAADGRAVDGRTTRVRAQGGLRDLVRVLLLVAAASWPSRPLAGADAWKVIVPVIELERERPPQARSRESAQRIPSVRANHDLRRGLALAPRLWPGYARVPARGAAKVAGTTADQRLLYGNAASVVPPVRFDLGSDVEREPSRASAWATERTSEDLRPAHQLFRADAIKSYSSAGTTRIVDDVARNALHLVPVPVESSTRQPDSLPGAGRFQRGADGRLVRRPDARDLDAARQAHTGSTQEDDEAAPPTRSTGPQSEEPTPLRRSPAETSPPTLVSAVVPAVRQTAAQPETVPSPLPSDRPPVAADAPRTDDVLKPIQDVTTDTAPPSGEMPKDAAAARFDREPAVLQLTGYSRDVMETEVNWQPPALCHRPLLFEHVNLERHGYEVRFVQPVLSAAHFFSRVPAVPYLMISERQRVCTYTLGHYRPGSHAPYVWYYPKFSLDGAALEGALIWGLVYLIP